MDGRFDLYGNADTILYFKLMDGEIALESDSTFARAQTFVLEAPSSIAEALAALPGFRLVDQEEVTSILVRK